MCDGSMIYIYICDGHGLTVNACENAKFVHMGSLVVGMLTTMLKFLI
jgi:hypothetical protein